MDKEHYKREITERISNYVGQFDQMVTSELLALARKTWKENEYTVFHESIYAEYRKIGSDDYFDAHHWIASYEEESNPKYFYEVYITFDDDGNPLRFGYGYRGYDHTGGRLANWLHRYLYEIKASKLTAISLHTLLSQYYLDGPDSVYDERRPIQEHHREQRLRRMMWLRYR